MRKAVVTLAIDIPRVIALSEPLFKVYAGKVQADYVKITRKAINHPVCPMLEKYQIYEILGTDLGQYERIIFFDADILVQPGTPNLFDIVPFKCVGGVYDHPENDPATLNRRRSMEDIQRILGDVDWKGGYFNTGVLVLSWIHRNTFQFHPKLLEIPRRTMLEQSTTNWNMHKNRYKYFRLSRDFNMIAYDRKDESYYIKERLAHVLHFAGRGAKPHIMKRYLNLIDLT